MIISLYYLCIVCLFSYHFSYSDNYGSSDTGDNMNHVNKSPDPYTSGK